MLVLLLGPHGLLPLQLEPLPTTNLLVTALVFPITAMIGCLAAYVALLLYAPHYSIRLALIAYGAWILIDPAPSRGGWRSRDEGAKYWAGGMWFRSLPIWPLLCGFFPAELVKTGGDFVRFF